MRYLKHLTLAAVFAAGLAAAGSPALACEGHAAAAPAGGSAAATANRAAAKSEKAAESQGDYVCPMGPECSGYLKAPGECPKCGMKLVHKDTLNKANNSDKKK